MASREEEMAQADKTNEQDRESRRRRFHREHGFCLEIGREILAGENLPFPALDDHGHPLSTTNTEGDQAKFRFSPAHFVKKGN